MFMHYLFIDKIRFCFYMSVYKGYILVNNYDYAKQHTT